MLRPVTDRLKRLYDWVLGWADSPYAPWALFAIAFAESSFFPIPPDILLIALAIGMPRRAFRFALISSVGSVLGGAMGYLIGHEFYNLLGEPIVRFYGAEEHYDRIAGLYDRYNALAIAVAGLTPIPYKVATITAGVFNVDFATFFLASLITRSARFFMIAGLIRAFGPQVKAFIEKHFEILSITALVMLVAGFVVLGWITGG